MKMSKNVYNTTHTMSYILALHICRDWWLLFQHSFILVFCILALFVLQNICFKIVSTPMINILMKPPWREQQRWSSSCNVWQGWRNFGEDLALFFHAENLNILDSLRFTLVVCPFHFRPQVFKRIQVWRLRWMRQNNDFVFPHLSVLILMSVWGHCVAERSIDSQFSPTWQRQQVD